MFYEKFINLAFYEYLFFEIEVWIFMCLKFCHFCMYNLLFSLYMEFEFVKDKFKQCSYM